VAATAGDASATVTWTAPSDGGSAITSYTVTASPGGATLGAGGGASSLLFTGLTNGTSYTFTVFASNAVGSGALSAPSAPVTPSAGGSAIAFPLVTSANRRYLQDQNGTPVPILGRAYWGIIGLSSSNYRTAIQDALNKGFNAIEFRAPDGSQQDNFVPKDGAGNLPFTSKVGGGSYTGSFSETPDFSTPNEAYWAFVDQFIDYCQSVGVMVLWFPAYIGYDSSSEGWGNVMVANGATRMRSFGTYVANRYKTRKNIIWMLGGDRGTGVNPFTANEVTVEQAMIDGLLSVSAQQSTQYAAEWNSDSIGTDQGSFGGYMTLDGAYSFVGNTGTQARRGYQDAALLPTFLLEEPYDEEGSDGTGKNGNASQPVRRFVWWGMLNGIGGYMAGNGYLIHFFPGYSAHFSSQGQIDLANLNAFWRSLPWQRLVPSGLSGIGTLVTAGAGSIDTLSYVAAAATPERDLLVAYLSSNAANPTIDMTKLSGTVHARWFNPSSGVYTDIGSFPNTGTHTFTKPGNNGTGFSDWVLVLTGS